MCVVAADADDRQAGRRHAAGVEPGPVDLELDSCSGISKPSCGPWNSHERLPLPRIAQASEPPRISAADAVDVAAFGAFRPLEELAASA